jgi:hydroxypyruvate isomerase
MTGFTLAASAEMLFLDRPHLDRVRRIHELGFAVEIWDWTAKDIGALGATFTSMTGYVTGRLADPDGADELVRTAELSVPVAHKLGNPVLNLHGNPHLRMMVDVYHAQIGEGNLIELLRRAGRLGAVDMLAAPSEIGGRGQGSRKLGRSWLRVSRLRASDPADRPAKSRPETSRQASTG